MELKNQPDVKPEFKLLRLIIISVAIVAVLSGIFFIVANLLPSKKSKASTPTVYDISGYVLSSANATIYDKCNSGDTLRIKSGLTINKLCDKLKNKDVLVLVDGSSIIWSGNYAFYIGQNGKLFLKNGSKISVKSGITCSYRQVINFGSTPTVSCDGKSATFTFDQVNNYGGVSYAGLTVLPVKLISFNAKYDKEVVKLEWATATEINNSHFEVQRSTDKSNWKTVGTVKGNGNSSTIIKYSFEDMVGKLTGEIYYRLNQIDYDGKNEYSNVKIVSLNNTKVNLGKVYPNPANDIVKVNINTDEDYTIILQDMSGKEILRQQGSSSIETLNVAEIPAGIYFVKIQNDAINESHRIVIRH